MDIKRLRRAKCVIQALDRYGLMSTQSLDECLGYKRRQSSLNKILLRLLEEGLIVRRPYEYTYGPVYFHLAYTKRNTEKFKTIFRKENYKEILPQKFYTASLRHDDLVSKAHISFDQLGLNTENFNEQQFVKAHCFSTIMFSDDKSERSLFPDITMLVRGENPNVNRLNLAIEVELHLKDKKRLAKKLYHYAMKTRFDGVLYFLGQEAWKDLLEGLYKRKVMGRAFRLGRMENVFVGYAPVHRSRFDPRQLELGFGEKKYSFLEWVKILWSKKYPDKMDNFPRLQCGHSESATCKELCAKDSKHLS